MINLQPGQIWKIRRQANWLVFVPDEIWSNFHQMKIPGRTYFLVLEEFDFKKARYADRLVADGDQAFKVFNLTTGEKMTIFLEHNNHRRGYQKAMLELLP